MYLALYVRVDRFGGVCESEGIDGLDQDDDGIICDAGAVARDSCDAAGGYFCFFCANSLDSHEVAPRDGTGHEQRQRSDFQGTLFCAAGISSGYFCGDRWISGDVATGGTPEAQVCGVHAVARSAGG